MQAVAAYNRALSINGNYQPAQGRAYPPALEGSRRRHPRRPVERRPGARPRVTSRPRRFRLCPDPSAAPFPASRAVTSARARRSPIIRVTNASTLQPSPRRAMTRSTISRCPAFRVAGRLATGLRQQHRTGLQCQRAALRHIGERPARRRRSPPSPASLRAPPAHSSPRAPQWRSCGQAPRPASAGRAARPPRPARRASSPAPSRRP